MHGFKYMHAYIRSTFSGSEHDYRGGGDDYDGDDDDDEGQIERKCGGEFEKGNGQVRENDVEKYENKGCVCVRN